MINLAYLFGDLTSRGVPKTTGVSFVTDEQVYKFSPERYSFYMQVLQAIADPKSKLLDTVLGIENRSRLSREKMEHNLKEAANNIQYLYLKEKEGLVGGDGNADVQAAIDNLNKISGFTIVLPDDLKDLVIKTKTSAADAILKLKSFETDQSEKNKYETEGAIKEVISNTEKLQESVIKTSTQMGSVPNVPVTGTSGNPPAAAASSTSAAPVTSTSVQTQNKPKQPNITPENIQAVTNLTINAKLALESFKKSVEFFEEKSKNDKQKIVRKTCTESIPKDTSCEAARDISSDLTALTKSNIFLNEYSFVNVDPQKGGEGLLEKMNKKFEDAAGDKQKKREFMAVYENDPILSPKNTEITAVDRIIFIATIFVVRAIALFMVEWALNSYMVTKFSSAFFLYIGIYIALFLLIVFLANASKEQLFFRMLFYYLSSNPHGYGRTIMHVALHVILFPVPFVVSERSDVSKIKSEYPTFEERRAIYRTVSTITFIIWILAAVIAIRF